MPLRVQGLHFSVGVGEQEVYAEALRVAGLTPQEVTACIVVRRSLDRRHGGTRLVCTVDLDLADERPPGRSGDARVRYVATPRIAEPAAGEEPLEHQPVVVGSGPAGLFAALWMARRGFRPVVIERGEPMNLRVRRVRAMNATGALDPESNYLFGEGGAGTFSDGKLTSRSKDPRARAVLEEFRVLSGVGEVISSYRPHLGSERIRVVVGRIRAELLERGATLRFGCRVEDLLLKDGTVCGVRTSNGELPATQVVLAPGHSARDLLRRLLERGVAMERKPFQMGFRVEHPQGLVDRAVWKELAGRPELGPADYRLSVRSAGRSVYSFCMCPGGEIMAAVCDLAHMNTNGMSHTNRSSGFANSGIVTTVEPGQFGGEQPLAGVELQERFEERAAELAGHGLAVPGQRLADYLAGRPSQTLPENSCRTGVVPASMAEVLPGAVERTLRGAFGALAGQLRGFLSEEALLVGPEARSSSPVRILRAQGVPESASTPGLLPVGEGAGHAGGIVSAAVDGVRAAQAVCARFRPPA